MLVVAGDVIDEVKCEAMPFSGDCTRRFESLEPRKCVGNHDFFGDSARHELADEGMLATDRLVARPCDLEVAMRQRGTVVKEA